MQPYTPRICRVFLEKAAEMWLSYGGWSDGWVCVRLDSTFYFPINSTPEVAAEGIQLSQIRLSLAFSIF